MNMLKLLPPVFSALREIKALYGENGAVKKKIEELNDDIAFVKKAVSDIDFMNREMLERAAEMYSCRTAKDTEALRDIIKLKTADRRPYTPEKLNDLLCEICTEGQFEIQYDVSYKIFFISGTFPMPKYIMKLTVALKSPSQWVYNAVEELLEKIVPVDIALEIGTFDDFITYGDLAQYSYGNLSERKYSELRRR